MGARGVAAIAIAVALLTGTLVALTDGNIGAALAPAVALAGLAAIVRLPLRWTLGALFVLVLLVHNPGSGPMCGRWVGPLALPGVLVFENLHKTVGVEALRFNLVELLLAVVLAVAAARRFTGDAVDGPAPPRPAVLVWSLRLSVAAVLGWCAWGVARSGDARMMLWQVRQLVWLPVLGLLFLRYLRGPEARRFFFVAMLTVGATRALEGIYFLHFVARPAGWDLPYVMTHDDSVLFGMCVSLGLMVMLELPHLRRNPWLWAAVVLVVYGMFINGRRMAWVELGAAALVAVPMLRWSLRRRVLQIMMVTAPLLVGYVVAGQYSTSKIFAPVHSVLSVADDDNSSNAGRQQENKNLVLTVRANPVVGTGFGQPYIEMFWTFDIASVFAMYRYIAHNGVLWLWAMMGLVGVTLAWLYLPVFVLLARRAYDRAIRGEERVAALGCIVLVVLYLLQAYGDMGHVSWAILAQMSAGLSVAGSLAAELQAWPVTADARAPSAASV